MLKYYRTHTVEFCYNVINGKEQFVSLLTMCRINQCRYNQVRLHIFMPQHTWIWSA